MLKAIAYNSASGRFLSVDPLFKSFSWNSCYSYAEGDVISCIDLDGLERYHYLRMHDDFGNTAIVLVGITDIVETEFKWFSFIWFGIEVLDPHFVTHVNERKEYVVHDFDRVFIDNGVKADWYEYEETATFTTYEGAMGCQNNDFVGTTEDHFANLQVGLAAVATEHRIGHIPGAKAQGASVARQKNAEEVHHLQPVSLKNHPFVQKAFKGGFKMQGSMNKTPLEKFCKSNGYGVHGNHPKYTQQIKDHLQSLDMSKFSDTDAALYLQKMNSHILSRIKSSPGVKLNDLDLKLNTLKK